MIARSRKATPYRRTLRTLGATFLLSAFAFTAAAQDPIMVVLDQAKVIKLPERVVTLVVGNPLIADVSVQQGGVMVVTGKGYGYTNVVALDRNGSVMLETPIQVSGPRDGLVVVYRGNERESYNCAPTCERRVTLGDTQAYFDATLNQTVTRTGQAQGAAGGGAR